MTSDEAPQLVGLIVGILYLVANGDGVDQWPFAVLWGGVAFAVTAVLMYLASDRR